jgi:pimeloyl-ACP methyl ester carboxylesterase
MLLARLLPKRISMGTALLGLGLTGCPSFHAGPLPGAPKGATYADVEGVRVRYEDKGSGPPVVLVHGFASSLETWLTVTPVLAKTHRVLSLDLKGFGWTGRPAGDYSPAAQAKIVLALMKERGIEKADLVAHSWGSSVALATVLAAPDRIGKIALYDAWVYEEQLPTFFLWARQPGLGEILFSLWYDQRPDDKMSNAFFDKRFVSEALVEDVERALERPGTIAAALAATRGQRFFEVQDRYRTIRHPTLLLWGREDEVTLLTFGERLSRELPNARLVAYPRCGHFPMIEAAAESTHELARFLEPESPKAPEKLEKGTLEKGTLPQAPKPKPATEEQP